MRGTLFGYVLRTYLLSFVGILAGVVAVFLVVDFVDRAKAYGGEGWVWDVMKLYGYKGLVSVQQLGPAALLLAAGTTVSSLRKRGEVTAMRALTFGPSALYVPIGVCALVACVGLVFFEENVATHAGRRVDDITTQRFNRWGDWGLYYTPKQWFRRGDQIFFLRGGDAQGGFDNVSVLTLTKDFRLRSRLDAAHMQSVDGTRWELTDVIERSFTDDGRTQVRQDASREVDLGVGARTFRIRPGRPEQMRVRELREQVVARAEVGLDTRQYELAMHNRFAYSLAGLPAALLAVGLALRTNRRGHLTAAIVEGLLITVAMWGIIVICRTLVLSERLAPPVAAWMPMFLLSVAAATLWLRGEGWVHLPRRWFALR
ncbi:LptF/LptG family permease [Myxococcaceae bacterium JPH2]|nr:LptF/LptG family permease [Myxococcaceae bacterium JPH2]